MAPVEIIEKDGQKVARLVVSFHGYGPDDITVRPVEDKLLVIDVEGSVMAEYCLPESVDPYNVEADMSEDGTLTVEAILMS